MTTLDQLRASLDRLDEALGAAGLALHQARQDATPADVKAVLKTYGISQRPKCQRLLWLEDHAALLRWHRGEAPPLDATTIATD